MNIGASANTLTAAGSAEPGAECLSSSVSIPVEAGTNGFIFAETLGSNVAVVGAPSPAWLSDVRRDGFKIGSRLKFTATAVRLHEVELAGFATGEQFEPSAIAARLSSAKVMPGVRVSGCKSDPQAEARATSASTSRGRAL